MKILDGGLENVPGYRFSAVKAEIKYKDRLDYCLIVPDVLCNASGMFTTNLMAAAPVKLCRERIGNPVSAIVINATNANACTGTEGYENAKILTGDIAARLHSSPESVLMCSTGVIGRQLPAEKMIESHGELVKNLSRENGTVIPRAIMTTDTYPKAVSVSFSTGRGDFTIAGTAKGSGMIAPDMATLLCYIITDAPVSKENLDIIFRSTVETTLNAITIDGDMSTNDTAIILSPLSGNPLSSATDLEIFMRALLHVMSGIAEMLIHDAEGATKLVRIHVINAESDEDAKKAARAISESLLVKTAFFGRDPNWGRIAAAAGYSGAMVKEESLTVMFENITVLSMGKPGDYDRNSLMDVLSKREFSVTVDLGLGSGRAMMITSDISYDYVRINAEYTT